MQESTLVLTLKVLIAPLVAGAVASWVTMRFSYHRYCSERWWERKAEAYAGILQHLTNMRLVLTRQIDFMTDVCYLNKEQARTLWKNYDGALDAIEQAASEGAYILSDSSITALHTLLKRLHPPGQSLEDWYGDDIKRLQLLAKSVEVLDGCVQELRAVAKRDLRVK